MLEKLTYYEANEQKYYDIEDVLSVLSLEIDIKKVLHYCKAKLNEAIVWQDKTYVSETYVARLKRRYGFDSAELIGNGQPNKQRMTIDFTIKDFEPYLEAINMKSVIGHNGQFTDKQIERRKVGFKKIIQLMMYFVSIDSAPLINGIGRDLMAAEYLAGLRKKYFPELDYRQVHEQYQQTT